jgi:hypothetical protein
MSPWTPEQAEILKATGHTIFNYIGSVHQIVDQLLLRLAALEGIVMLRVGVTPEELEALRAELGAARAVDIALSPEIQALEDEFNRLLGGEPGGDRHA